MRVPIAFAVASAAVAGCATTPPDGPVDPVAPPLASFITDDLVQVLLDYTGEPAPESLRLLTDCAAAEAISLRGEGYARHVRTSLSEEAGISRADAVYTVSPTRPAGDFVIDANAFANECRALGTEGV